MYWKFDFVVMGPAKAKNGVTFISMTLTEKERSLNFRHAAATDAALLAKLNRDLIRDEGHRNTMTLAELEQRMAGWIAGQYNAVLFERQAETLGYALYRPEVDYIYLRQFFVCPQHRRRGVGRAAIEWLQANAWAKAPRVRVEVLVTNSAGIAFWRSLGFAEYCITMERETEDSRQSGG